MANTPINPPPDYEQKYLNEISKIRREREDLEQNIGELRRASTRLESDFTTTIGTIRKLEAQLDEVKAAARQGRISPIEAEQTQRSIVKERDQQEQKRISIIQERERTSQELSNMRSRGLSNLEQKEHEASVNRHKAQEAQIAQANQSAGASKEQDLSNKPSNTPQNNLTPDAQDPLKKTDQGGGTGAMTNNLEQIVRENNIDPNLGATEEINTLKKTNVPEAMKKPDIASDGILNQEQDEDHIQPDINVSTPKDETGKESVSSLPHTTSTIKFEDQGSSTSSSTSQINTEKKDVPESKQSRSGLKTAGKILTYSTPVGAAVGIGAPQAIRGAVALKDKITQAKNERRIGKEGKIEFGENEAGGLSGQVRERFDNKGVQSQISKAQQEREQQQNQQQGSQKTDQSPQDNTQEPTPPISQDAPASVSFSSSGNFSSTSSAGTASEISNTPTTNSGFAASAPSSSTSSSQPTPSPTEPSNPVKITTSSPVVVAQPPKTGFKKPTPKPPAPPKSKKQKGLGAAKTTGKVLMYSSPVGFVAGVAAPRIKERIFAKTAVKEEVAEAQKQQKETATQTAKKNKEPHTNRSFFKTATRLPILAIPIFWPVLATKKGREFFFGKKETKDDATEKTTTHTEKKAASEKKPVPKSNIGKKLLFLAFPVTFPILVSKKVVSSFRREKNTQEKQEIKTPHTPKTAKAYQREKNKNILLKAMQKGYNRRHVLDSLLSAKAMRGQVERLNTRVLNTQVVKRPMQHFSNRKEHNDETRPQSRISNAYQNFTRPNLNMLSRGGSFFNPPKLLGGRRSPSVGGRLAKNAGSKATKALGKKLASQTVLTAGKAFLLSGPGLVIVGVAAGGALIFVLVMNIVLLMSGGGENSARGGTPNTTQPQDPTQQKNPIPGFSLSVSALGQIDTCQDITATTCAIEYTVTYSYEPQGSIKLTDITVYNKLPSNTEFISAGSNAQYDSGTKTVSWKLSDTTNVSPLTIALKPNANNIRVSNNLYALAIPAGSGIIAPASDTLAGVFEAAATEYGIPSALTRAIAKTESGAHDNYTNEDVIRFNQAGWFSGLSDDAPTKEELPEPIRNGYAYNTCAYPKSNPICPGYDVRGITQFLDTTWNTVKTRIPTISGSEGDRRYVADAVYGQARHTKDIIERYDADFGFSNNPTDFTEAQVKAIATSYCGGNPYADINVPACGDGAYDDNVWNYYQEIKSTQN